LKAAFLEGSRSELEWAAKHCQSRARAEWNPNQKERSEYWIRLKAQVADARVFTSASSGIEIMEDTWNDHNPS